METNVKKMLEEMANRAASAAEDARDVMEDTNRAVRARSSAAKLRVDAVRLRNECEDIYAQIGRTFYLMKTGKWPDDGETAEHRIESLLGSATEKEAQLSEIKLRVEELSGRVVCPNCRKSCEADAVYCPFCGQVLKKSAK